MKKRIITALLCSTLLFNTSTVVFADEKDNKIEELEARVVEMQTIIDDLQEQLAKYTSATTQEEYKIGDTWTVPGQWSLTVNSVEETSERSDFVPREPAAVYVITYTYENLGYEADGWNGLLISLDNGIMDSTGKMGYYYLGNLIMYPQETPVGGTCEAQSCVGVDNIGDIKIYFSQYDGTDTEQKAVFSLSVE